MILATLAVASVLLAQTPSAAQPPRAPRRPVTETHHGVEVVDPYRWLEEAGSPEVKEWTAAQGAAARAWLDALPSAKEIREQVREIVVSRSPFWSRLAERKGTWFAMKSDPARQQPVLVRLASPDDPAGERILLDPQAIDPSGKTNVDWFVPSPDGKRIAVSLSRGGTESGDLTIFDVATMKPVGEPIPRVHGGTAGGSMAWTGDGKGFWYTRYPREGERPAADLPFYQQVWFHRIGTPGSSDVKELGDELPRIAEITLRAKDDGKWVLAEVKDGDGGDAELWLRPGGKGSWSRLSRLQDKAVEGEFGDGPELFLLSRHGAPRGRLLRLPLPPPAKEPLAAARVVIQEGDDAIQAVVPARDRLYVTYLAGGPSRLAMFTPAGKPLGEVPILPVSTVGQVVPVKSRGILFQNVSWVETVAWYAFDPKSGKVSRTKLATVSPVDLSGAEAVRGFATSKDGTRVPVDVIRMKGTRLDGSNPAILYGYGGYGLSQTPVFSPLRALWLRNGGVYATAILRGRRRVRGGLAPGRQPDPQAERLRRLHRRGRVARAGRLHEAGAARHPGRVERRTPRERGGDAAAGALPGGGEPGGHLRRHPGRDHGQRRLQRSRVRHREGPGAVQGAPRVLPGPPGGGRDPLPGRAIDCR